MKRFMLMACLAGSAYIGMAQTDTSRNWFTDSSRIVQLSGVVVSAQQKNQQQNLASFFQKNGKGNLEEILSRLPEVNMTRRGSYGMEPGLRGVSGARVNVMVDGMRIHGACTDKMDPATIYIEPANLESIEMHTASGGALIGINTGGAFNFRMKEPELSEEAGWHIGLKSSYQSASEGFGNSAELEYQSPNFALRATGTHRKHQNYQSGTGYTVPFSQYEKVNYSLSLKKGFSKNLSLVADFIGDDGFNMGYAALPMDVGYASARIAALTLKKQMKGNWQEAKVKVYGNTIRHFMDDTQRPFVPMHMDMPGYSKTAGFFAEATLRAGSRDRFTFRADGATTHLSASMTMYPENEAPMYMLTWPDNRRNQWGLSAGWKHSFSKKWMLDVTGRGEYIHSRLTSEESKDHVIIFNGSAEDITAISGSATAALNWKAHQHWQLFVSAGYGSRIASASELYGFYLFNAQDGYDYIGRLNLNPEKSFNAEWGVQYQRNKTRARLTLFASRISDYITGLVDSSLSVMTIGAKGVKQYQNFGDATTFGGEGSAMVYLSKKINAVTTLRYVYGLTENDMPLAGISPFKNVTAINYHHKQLRIGAESEWSFAQNRFNVLEGEDATPSFHLMHLRVAYELQSKQVRLSLQGGIENLFDKAYHEHNDWGNILRPGRNIYFQVGFGF